MKFHQALIFSLSYIFVSTANAQQVIDTFAGGGPNGILAISAGIAQPWAVAVDGSGNLFIADGQNHRVIKVDSTGFVTTIAGVGFGFSGDGGPATAARLTNPTGVAVDSSGNAFIADQSNHRIRKVAANGVITTVAGTGVAGFLGDGAPATTAQLRFPSAVAVDSSGNVFIADRSNHRIRKVATNGIITTVAGTGVAGPLGDGAPATAAQLNSPAFVAVDNIGNLFIADTNNHRIRKVDTSGIITTIAGVGLGFSGDGGPATAAQLRFPSAVAADSSGRLFIADTDNHRIRKVDTSGIIITVAGNGSFSFCGENSPAIGACLSSPRALALDGTGNLFIADSNNHRIRRVDARTGIITTVAGNGAPGFSGDGGAATAAQLNGPSGVVVDISGNLFIADLGNDRIRKVNAVTNIITTVAGTGVASFCGDGGAATLACLRTPFGVALDSSGNLFIADFQNNRIRKVSNGIITTVAGTGVFGFNGDGGPATAARLGQPDGVALDALGNLFIGDQGNRRIRKVDALTGIISTVAGTGTFGFSGDGGPATAANLSDLRGLDLDASGNLFFADLSNNGIRKVDTLGIITTVAGTGAFGFSGDGGPATAATLGRPIDVALDSSGNLFIADLQNNRIRVVYSPNSPPVASAGGPYSVSEGSTVTLNASGSSDPDGDPLIFEWDLNYNGVMFVPTSGVTGAAPTVSAAGLDGPTDSRTIAVRVSDSLISSIATAALNVLNVAPVITGITVPLVPQPIGTVTNVSAPFTDAGTPDTHTCTIDWDDGAAPVTATVTEASGAGTCAGSRNYTVAGVYTVTVKVTDDDAGVATRTATDLIVVYDPSAGFVTGGGWINSPAGAYVSNTSVSGKANFGFVSKYKKGATVPTGTTEFQFHVANFNFHSSTYDWLVVSGPKAQYKGTGTVNGAGNYGFLLTATDGQLSGGGGTDKFRIKIWDKNNNGAIVYDNAPGSDDINSSAIQNIGGGSIVIH